MNGKFHVSVSGEVSFLEWRSCCIVEVTVRSDLRDFRISCLLLCLIDLGLLLLMHSDTYRGVHIAYVFVAVNAWLT